MKPKIDRKSQILVFATEAFSRDGYDKVTVKQLADQCGITEPAIYRHFASKDAIYIGVLESLRDRLKYEELFKQLEQENDLESLLRSIARHIIAFYTENADIYRLLLYAALRGHDKAKRIFELIRGPYVRFLVEQLDRMHQQGLIVKKQSEITARCFVGMVFDCAMGNSLWKGLQGKSYDPETIVNNNVPIYVRGLKS
ncbi:MAG: TetR/AcrR family transcriptional regulator [Candidatus Zixiibacteriota bacterium]